LSVFYYCAPLHSRNDKKFDSGQYQAFNVRYYGFVSVRKCNSLREVAGECWFIGKDETRRILAKNFDGYIILRKVDFEEICLLCSEI
jgi:hypothetical protein